MENHRFHLGSQTGTPVTTIRSDHVRQDSFPPNANSPLQSISDETNQSFSHHHDSETPYPKGVRFAQNEAIINEIPSEQDGDRTSISSEDTSIATGGPVPAERTAIHGDNSPGVPPPVSFLPTHPPPHFPGMKSYIFMFSLFVVGIATAVGQHILYQYLDGKVVDDVPVSQTWIIRSGTAFAFLFKTVLVAATGIAFIQGFWYVIRRKALTVRGIDATFSALYNPLSFFSLDLLLETRFLFVISIVSWCIPISAIISPGALTVVSSPQTSIQQINATDFEFDEIELFNQGSDDTYRGPSDDLQRLVFRVFVSTEIISSPSPCGSNCSYDFEFFGPAFQCTVVDVLPEIINATFYNTSMGGADEPSLTNYISFTQDYQNETGIWIAYDPPGGGLGVGNLETFFCAMFNATYNTGITYMNNLPNYNTSFTYHGQIANWTSYADDLEVLGLSYDLATSRQNFMSITQQIETMLAGVTYQTTFADNTEKTQIALFGGNDLTDVHPVYPTNLPEQIEDLMTNVTLSLRLRNQSTQPSDDQQTFIITASITAYPARYNYAVAVLWEAYGTAIACTAVCILVGSCMLFINGVDADRSFSQILVTTRHESLDRVCAGQDRGGEFRSDELRRLPLKYGRIETIEGPRFAFATSDEVETFRK